VKEGVKEGPGRDAKVLAFRKEGRSFVKIAALLEFRTAGEAVSAYRRALSQRSPKEQASLRAAERERFDAMAKSIRADTALSAAEAAKRLARVERLRAALG
jgi:hypothetical protein